MKYSIKELRARFNWTQEQAAKKVGISIDRWRRMEAKPGTIPMSVAAKMAEQFGVKIDEIFF